MKGELRAGLCSACSCPVTHGWAGAAAQGRPLSLPRSGVIPGAAPRLPRANSAGGGEGSGDAPALSRHSAAVQGGPEPSSRHHHHSRSTIRVSPGTRPRSRMETQRDRARRTELASPAGAAPLSRAEAAGQPQMAPVSRAGAAPPPPAKAARAQPIRSDGGGRGARGSQSVQGAWRAPLRAAAPRGAGP